jgi:hypothetical protein
MEIYAATPPQTAASSSQVCSRRVYSKHDSILAAIRSSYVTLGRCFWACFEVERIWVQPLDPERWFSRLTLLGPRFE